MPRTYKKKKLGWIKQHNERATLRAEYESIRDLCVKEALSFDLSFEDFCPIAMKDCAFCGGRTPTYSFNSVIRKPAASVYSAATVLTVCWPCKRHFKDQEGDLGKTLHRIQAISEHLHAHDLDL